MDAKTQQMIYILDAIECSVRSTQRLLGAMKVLMEPEQDPGQDPEQDPVKDQQDHPASPDWSALERPVDVGNQWRTAPRPRYVGNSIRVYTFTPPPRSRFSI